MYFYIYIERERERLREIKNERKRAKKERESPSRLERPIRAPPSRAFMFRAAISSDPAVVDVFKRPVRAPRRNRTGSSAELENNSETERVRATSASEAEVGS
jgi:hypothetical protein